MQDHVSEILALDEELLTIGADILERMDILNDNINGFNPLTEAEYTKVTNHLRLEILDVDRFVKVNECKPISSPIFYSRNNIPSPDGLLSYDIFGTTQMERAGIFGYIDLGGYYLDPSCYKCWTRIDKAVKEIINKTKKYSIDRHGYFVEDPDGQTGIDFIRKNLDKIKFKSSESVKRDMRIQYLEKNRNRMFINKYIVIPPYYRDTNSGGKSVGVGGVNKLYQQLIIAVNSLKGTQEYGFDMSGPMMGRVQGIILAIYDWFCGTTNANLNTDEGVGLSGKLGLLRRANTSKTSTYSARLVITGPELRSNRSEDMMTNFKKSAVPLTALIAIFRPFVAFHTKRFFENEFIGTEQYPVIDRKGNVKYVVPKDPLIEFSDERIKVEMEKFIHGYNKRFSPIRVPVEGSDSIVYMRFKGRYDSNMKEQETIYQRRLTWCDIFFMAVAEAIKDKMVLITRYPVDSRFNEIATEVEISSTKETEPMYVDGTYYRFYPKIREKDINTNTGNKFIDTLKLSNLYLEGLKGDYDGDTVTCKGVFTVEANEELKQFQMSKRNFIDLGGQNVRVSSADVIQSLYCLTKILDADKDKMVNPVF